MAGGGSLDLAIAAIEAGGGVAGIIESAEQTIDINTSDDTDPSPFPNERFVTHTFDGTFKLIRITAIQWKNGTVIAGNIQCRIVLADANPPTVVNSALVGKTIEVAASGVSAFQEAPATSQLIAGDAIVMIALNGDGAAHRLAMTTVANRNNARVQGYTSNVPEQTEEGYTATTSEPQIKIKFVGYS